MEELLYNKDKWQMDAGTWLVYHLYIYEMVYKKHQRRNHMSKVGLVRNTLYKNGLKRMATAWHNAVERRMSESRVRENLTHGLMRGKRAKPSNLLYKNKEKESGLKWRRFRWKILIILQALWSCWYLKVFG